MRYLTRENALKQVGVWRRARLQTPSSQEESLEDFFTEWIQSRVFSVLIQGVLLILERSLVQAFFERADVDTVTGAGGRPYFLSDLREEELAFVGPPAQMLTLNGLILPEGFVGRRDVVAKSLGVDGILPIFSDPHHLVDGTGTHINVVATQEGDIAWRGAYFLGDPQRSIPCLPARAFGAFDYAAGGDFVLGNPQEARVATSYEALILFPVFLARETLAGLAAKADGRG